MKKPWPSILLILVLAPLGYLAGLLCLNWLTTEYPGLRPFVMLRSESGESLNVPAAALAPVGLLGIITMCLLAEVAILGYARSSLKRLFVDTSASSKVDLFYLTLRVGGGIHLLAFVFSFGSVYFVANQIHDILDIGVLQSVDSYVFQFVVIYLVNTLLFYWAHRLMHVPWLWEIHKVHHAAEEMNIVTPLRNHPVDFMIMTVLNTCPAAILGAAPIVTLSYHLVNGFYQSLVHSELDVKHARWDRILITPAAHRIHHSNRPDHWGKNFGILTLWDKLFGTYHAPVAEALSYGVEDKETYNRREHVRELFDNVRRWLTRLRR